MTTARKPKVIKFPTRIQPKEHFATKADIERLRAGIERKMSDLKFDLIKWVIAIMGIFSSIIIAAVKP